MASISKSSKLPGKPEEFFYEAGGYILLRIARDNHEESFSVMTATASENAALRAAARHRPNIKGGLFFKDGTRVSQHREPDPVHPFKSRAFPSLSKLIQVAKEVRGFARAKEQVDNWGRPYIVLRGVESAAEVRRLGDALAHALGLEVSSEPWAYEEMQSIYEEFSHEDGQDAYLNDGMSVSAFGDLKDR